MNSRGYLVIGFFFIAAFGNTALGRSSAERTEHFVGVQLDQHNQSLDSTIAPPFPYPGGFDAMVRFINQNFQYPKKSLKNGIEGDVFIEVILRKDGSVKEYNLAQGIPGGEDINDEAMRVAKLLKFSPQNSTNPEELVAIVIPFKLRIQGNEKKSSWVFPQGNDSLKKFIRENLAYPAEELQNEVTTIVLVKVFVGMDGRALEISTDAVYGENKKSYKNAAKDVASKIEKYKWSGDPKSREKGYVLFYVMFDKYAKEKANKPVQKG